MPAWIFKSKAEENFPARLLQIPLKNAATALLCASLLNKGKTVIKKAPKIEEVTRILEVMRSIGVSAKWNEDDIEIRPPEKISMKNLNKEAAKKTRSILMFAGPLLHVFNSFSLPNVGGCKLGSRTVRPHLYALEKLGASIKVEGDQYKFSKKRLKPNHIVMYESGDTATENVIMTAAKIPGKTIIKLASSNYMVQDLCFFLQKLGVEIKGIGTSTLTIHGVEEIDTNIEYFPAEDPTESMFFIAAAVVTKSELTIKRCPIDFLELELLKLEKNGTSI